MGTRSASQTALDIVHALLLKRTISQSELAQELGVRSEVVRKHLVHLQEHGVPLEAERDGRHVFWSVPPSWAPRGLLIEHEEAYELVKLAARTPRTKRRDRLIKRLCEGLLEGQSLRRKTELVIASGELDAGYVELVEEAALARRPLTMKYYSMGRGALEWRDVSIQRVVPPLRFIARCHRDDKLKWFRIDNISDARMADERGFRDCPVPDVEAFAQASVYGFNDNAPVVAHTFTVRSPESRWVQQNLPHETATTEPIGDGIRVTVRSASVSALARYVLGLGGAARPESDALRGRVRQLANDALAHCEPG